jgi:lipopolysaccharide transport system permease protein
LILKNIEIVITPKNIEKNYWTDIWNYRELFYILSWRDLKVRYKQTALGVLWSVIRPLLTTLIFTVFGSINKLPTEGTAPYAIMVYVAMLPWQFFANSLSESSNSLVGNANLISKVYFPRIIIPASAIVTSFVDFLISFVILLGLFIWYQFIPSWHIIFLPFLLFVAFIAAFGCGLFLTALNVKYRDFRYIIPFIVQFGLYISPVAFSSSMIPEKWRLIYSLNPMVGVIDGFRWAVIGDVSSFSIIGFSTSIAICIVILFFAVRYFRKTEKTFADLI